MFSAVSKNLEHNFQVLDYDRGLRADLEFEAYSPCGFGVWVHGMDED